MHNNLLLHYIQQGLLRIITRVKDISVRMLDCVICAEKRPVVELTVSQLAMYHHQTISDTGKIGIRLFKLFLFTNERC